MDKGWGEKFGAFLPWKPWGENPLPENCRQRLAILNGTLALAPPEPEPVVEPAVPAVEVRWFLQWQTANQLGILVGRKLGYLGQVEVYHAWISYGVTE